MPSPLTVELTDDQAEAIVAVLDATPEAEHYLDMRPGGHALDQAVLIIAGWNRRKAPAIRRVTVTGDGDLLTAMGETTDTAEIGRWYDHNQR